MTRYDIYYATAVEGQIADSTFQRDVITMPNNTTPLAFGVPVALKGAAVNDATGSNPVVEKATSASTKILGISLFRQPTEPTYPSNSIAYEYLPSSPVSILTTGRIYVQVKVGVIAFTDAYIDSTGAFTNESTGGNKKIGFFFTGGAASSLAVLQINLSANVMAGLF